jgi:predicted adenine nucleotide alpha hydrolase (AANH) superfamily ATPase
LNSNPKKFGKKDPNERGIRCSVCYIFMMMVKLGKIGMKFEKTLFGIKSLKNVNQITSPNYPKLPLKINYYP